MIWCEFLQVAKALGNSKPTIVQVIELSLWKSLLSIALGQDSPYNAMNTFFGSFDWEDLKRVDAHDRNYFGPGMTTPVVSYCI
jgi:hypothetical protein